MQKFDVQSRLWITTEEGTFLGEGRVALLQQIEISGSISKAAKEMGMSYKKAWRLVDSMNKFAPSPLVIQQIGGTGGGGTLLSEAGKKAIASFRALQVRHQAFLKEQSETFNIFP